MNRLRQLAVLAVCLSPSGCEPPATHSTSIVVPITNEVKPTAAAVVERVGGRGTSAVLYDRYRVACALDGTVARPTSEIGATVVVTRSGSDEVLPDTLAIVLRLESGTLGDREFTIGPVGAGEGDAVRVEKQSDLVQIKFAYVYGTGPKSNKALPVGKHKIQVSTGLEGKEVVRLPDVLFLEVLPTSSVR